MTTSRVWLEGRDIDNEEIMSWFDSAILLSLINDSLFLFHFIQAICVMLIWFLFYSSFLFCSFVSLFRSSRWGPAAWPDCHLAPLPGRARWRLHHQEQPHQAPVSSSACSSDLLQVQRRMGPPESAHVSGAHWPSDRYIRYRYAIILHLSAHSQHV